LFEFEQSKAKQKQSKAHESRSDKERDREKQEGDNGRIHPTHTPAPLLFVCAFAAWKCNARAKPTTATTKTASKRWEAGEETTTIRTALNCLQHHRPKKIKQTIAFKTPCDIFQSKVHRKYPSRVLMKRQQQQEEEEDRNPVGSELIMPIIRVVRGGRGEGKGKMLQFTNNKFGPLPFQRESDPRTSSDHSRRS